jgi:hypothetical protein
MKFLVLALLLQDPALAEIPDVRASALPGDRVLVFASRMEKAHAGYLASLRKVPALEPKGEPTSLVIPRHLKRPARAFDADRLYLESDWMSSEELAVAAALVDRAARASCELLGTPDIEKVRYVVTRTRDDYHALVDAWSEDDRVKRGARFVSSTFVDRTRAGFAAEAEEVYATAVSDAVGRACPPSFRRQDALVQALEAYVSSFLTGRFVVFVSLDVTTKEGRGRGPVEALMRTARDYLQRPKRDDLGTVLRSELNAITVERLAVAFAAVDYLLRTKRGAWARFAETVERESRQGKELKGPDGCHEALKAGLREAMGLELAELETALKDFTSREYLWEEDVARATGVQRECAESAFEGFVKVCELLRQGKPVSGRGEEIHRQVWGRVEKKLEAGRLPF